MCSNHCFTHISCPQTSSVSRTLVGNKGVDHSDVVGTSPVDTAPTTSSFSTQHLASMDWAKTTARRDKKHLSVGFGATYIRCLAVFKSILSAWEVNDTA